MPVVVDEDAGKVVHEETGGTFLLPDGFDGPKEWSAALFEANADGGSINREKFQGIGHCVFHLVAKERRMKREMTGAILEIAGNFPGGDEDRCKEAAKTVVQKVGEEVVPYVANQLFDWLDRDKDKGVSQAEVEAAMNLFMEAEEEDKGPEAAFGMLFDVIDTDGNKKLSTDEISAFFAKFVDVAGDCVLAFINVVSATFRDEMVDGVVNAAFEALDQNGDGKLDKEELAMMIGGLEQMGAGLAEARANCDDGPEKMIIDAINETVETCNDAGDLSPEGFYELCNKLTDKRVQYMTSFIDQGVAEGELPLPPPLYEAIKPLIDTGVETLLKTFKETVRPVTDSYFDLLDANSDGVLQHDELMALMNVFSADQSISAEDKFNALFALVDTDGDGQIDNSEGTAFGGKGYDLAVDTAKFGVGVYQAIAKAVAQAFIKFFVEKLAGGDELSQDAFNSLAGTFAEQGPEALMAPLMEME